MVYQTGGRGPRPSDWSRQESDSQEHTHSDVASPVGSSSTERAGRPLRPVIPNEESGIPNPEKYETVTKRLAGLVRTTVCM